MLFPHPTRQHTGHSHHQHCYFHILQDSIQATPSPALLFPHPTRQHTGYSITSTAISTSYKTAYRLLHHQHCYFHILQDSIQATPSPALLFPHPTRQHTGHSITSTAISTSYKTAYRPLHHQQCYFHILQDSIQATPSPALLFPHPTRQHTGYSITSTAISTSYKTAYRLLHHQQCYFHILQDSIQATPSPAMLFPHPTRQHTGYSITSNAISTSYKTAYRPLHHQHCYFHILQDSIQATPSPAMLFPYPTRQHTGYSISSTAISTSYKTAYRPLHHQHCYFHILQDSIQATPSPAMLFPHPTRQHTGHSITSTAISTSYKTAYRLLHHQHCYFHILQDSIQASYNYYIIQDIP